MDFRQVRRETKIFSSLVTFLKKVLFQILVFDRGTYKLDLDIEVTDKINIPGILNYQNATQDQEMAA
jgi:hypothetical protein